MSLFLSNIFKINKTKYIHFIGIGGIGMSGIAKILLFQGYRITGSDVLNNKIVKNLIKLGIKIFFNHKKENIKNSSIVIYSSAIDKNNPEIIAAKKNKIPIFKRAQILFELMRFSHSIAVSGTHGKTTTTAMIIDIYKNSGLDPTFINGGLIKPQNINAYLGKSKYFITEADESDQSFLYLKPSIIIVTNIERDHMDFYKGNFEKIKESFIKFLNNLPCYGLAILCIDDPVIRLVISKIKCSFITYGFSYDADVRIINYKQIKKKSVFIISRKKKIDLKFTLNLPGYHNVLNAAAAIAVSTEEKIKDCFILNSLKNFQGVYRRFDLLGNFFMFNINYEKISITLIDDYGHHPTELKMVIRTIKKGWPKRRIIMIFQPHKYTRTRDFYNSFIKILEEVNILLILNIYPAGENPIKGIHSKLLCRDIKERGKVNPIFIKKRKNIMDVLVKIAKNNDLILTQGAGDVGELLHNLIKLNYFFIDKRDQYV